MLVWDQHVQIQSAKVVRPSLKTNFSGTWKVILHMESRSIGEACGIP